MQIRSVFSELYYFLVYKKNIRFDFDDELKIGGVRYDKMI